MLKQRILIIEDDEILSKVIKKELDETDFETHQAFDGKAGLEMAGEIRPSLILLDIMMPKMNGFEVLELLKNNPEVQDIPVFILTALDSDDDIKKGIELGAKDYIVKSQHAVTEIVGKVVQFLKKGSVI